MWSGIQKHDIKDNASISDRVMAKKTQVAKTIANTQETKTIHPIG